MNLERTFDDATLVTLIKEGNHLAFQEVYHRYFDKVFGYAYNLLQDRAYAEEVIQEVFVSLWTKRETISITTSLSGYLYSMVKHAVLNYLKAENVRARYAEQHEQFLKHRADNSNVEYQNITDLEHAIQRSLSELSDQERLAFKLSRQDHLTIREVAEKMKLSTGRVENIISKVLKHLREKLLLITGILAMLALYPG